MKCIFTTILQSWEGEYCYLLTKEKAEAQSLEVIYRNHIAIKRLSWNSDRSFSAQFRVHSFRVLSHGRFHTDSQWWQQLEIRVRQTLESPLLRFLQNGNTEKRRGDKKRLPYDVCGFFKVCWGWKRSGSWVNELVSIRKRCGLWPGMPSQGLGR